MRGSEVSEIITLVLSPQSNKLYWPTGERYRAILALLFKQTIAVIPDWVGYACFDKKQEIDEPKLFLLFRCITLQLLHVMPSSNTKCT